MHEQIKEFDGRKYLCECTLFGYVNLWIEQKCKTHFSMDLPGTEGLPHIFHVFWRSKMSVAQFLWLLLQAPMKSKRVLQGYNSYSPRSNWSAHAVYVQCTCRVGCMYAALALQCGLQLHCYTLHVLAWVCSVRPSERIFFSVLHHAPPPRWLMVDP